MNNFLYLISDFLRNSEATAVKSLTYEIKRVYFILMFIVHGNSTTESAFHKEKESELSQE